MSKIRNETLQQPRVSHAVKFRHTGFHTACLCMQVDSWCSAQRMAVSLRCCILRKSPCCPGWGAGKTGLASTFCSCTGSSLWGLNVEAGALSVPWISW